MSLAFLIALRWIVLSNICSTFSICCWRLASFAFCFLDSSNCIANNCGFLCSIFGLTLNDLFSSNASGVDFKSGLTYFTCCDSWTKILCLKSFCLANNLIALSSIKAWIFKLSSLPLSPNVPILAGRFSNSFNLCDILLLIIFSACKVPNRAVSGSLSEAKLATPKVLAFASKSVFGSNNFTKVLLTKSSLLILLSESENSDCKLSGRS